MSFRRSRPPYFGGSKSRGSKPRHSRAPARQRIQQSYGTDNTCEDIEHPEQQQPYPAQAEAWVQPGRFGRAPARHARGLEESLSQTYQQPLWEAPEETLAEPVYNLGPPVRLGGESMKGQNLAERFAYRPRQGGLLVREQRHQPAEQEVERIQPIGRPIRPEAYAQTPARRTAMLSEGQLPRTPWSNRQVNRPSWLRQPPEEIQDGESVSALLHFNYGSHHEYAQDTVRPISRQPQRVLAPPTPRYSSPSPSGRGRSAYQPTQTQHRLTQAPQQTTGINGITLISPKTLDKKYHSIFPYPQFNAMQSSCLPAVYGSSYNVVVASPTGSGKTVIFELAICALLAQKSDPKIVYLAPTKALCSERSRDWQKKFKPLGLQVAEFTGDSSAFEVRRVRTASIVVTTPEKWDSITRKWSDHGVFLKAIKLVLIDEVHILKDSRGATLETVVSRMKVLGSEVRFVALSATIPNSSDLAQWLGLNHNSPQMPAKTLVFDENFRPVRLTRIVLGYNQSGGNNEHSFDSFLDDQLPGVVAKHTEGKPVLIFCFTRKSAESAATVLAEYWMSRPPHQRPWPAPSVTIHGGSRLQNLLPCGVAFHHGGLERQDRDSVEAAFLAGHLTIICCTSTLAVGINLPCHTVILKGTMGYQSGKFSEYDEFEVMQMIGRAGRPQFDTSAKAIILTRTETQDKYKALESGTQIVESTLHLNLIEHLNAEIALGTISSVATALQWLKGTFLAVRLWKNPDHYNLGELNDVDVHVRTTDDRLREICRAGIEKLTEAGLIQCVPDNANGDVEFQGTPYGSAMSTFMVRFDTMKMILNMPKDATVEQLLNMLSQASEFDDFRIKSTERPLLRELNKTQDVPFKFKDSQITETWQKISLLIQVELARGTLPYHHRIAFEARQIIECMQRLLESYLACVISDRDAHGTKIALELSRSLTAKAWEGHCAQLCQIPEIGPVNMKKLADKEVQTVCQLADLGLVGIQRFLTKNPPAAMKIIDALRSFPRLIIDGQVSQGQSQRTPDRRAIANVTIGYGNEEVPRWRGRVPFVTFFAATAAGLLVHIWRGKLPERQRVLSFPVPVDSAEAVTCYLTCDDLVGTMQSKSLPCATVPFDSLPRLTFEHVVANKPTAKKTMLPAEAGEVQDVHRQKRPRTKLNYPSQTIIVDDVAVDCIDLSAADDQADKKSSESWSNSALEGTTRQTTRSRFQSLAGSSAACGKGTAQSPWSLSDSESIDDAFDDDIFDDVDFPVVKEAEQPTLPRTPTLPWALATAEMPTVEMPPGSPSTLITEEVSSAALDAEEQNSSPMTKSVSEPVDDMLVRVEQSPAIAEDTLPLSFVQPQAVRLVDHGTAEEAGNLEPRDDVSLLEGPEMKTTGATEQTDSHRQGCQGCQPGCEHENQQDGQGPDGDASREEASLDAQEPSWIADSDMDIIDFLRGHVKFV